MTTPERPEDLFSPESIARIANHLFAQSRPASQAEPAPVRAVQFDAVEHALDHPATAFDVSSTSLAPAPNVGAVQGYSPAPVAVRDVDAVEHALDNPATAFDVSSTSLAPAPNVGAVDSYNLSTVDLGGFDNQGFEEVLTDLEREVLALRAPESDQSDLMDHSVVSHDEVPLLLDKVLQAPTDAEGMLAAAGGDHPYLLGKYEAVQEQAGADDAGAGEHALRFMRELAAIATQFTGEHAVTEPAVDDVAEVYRHSETFDEGSAATPVPTAQSEARLLSERIGPDVPEDTAIHPRVEPRDARLDIAPTTTGFNAHRYRQDFPILSERVHGQPLVWLDNGATTQKPRQVIDRLSYFYEHENSNVHRTAHTLAGRATDAYEGARDKVRGFINAPSSDDIVWVRGTTEGINLLANTFGEQRVCEGDEILISWLEHHANIVPWQMLCRRKGAVLKVAPVDDTGQIILSEFERLITPRTKIVSLTQVSNALGTITPAKEMVEIAHRHGVPVVIDGAQGVLHMPVDVQDLDCDFYVFSGHKMFAPTGIGVVYGKQEHLRSMPPWQGGGNMIDEVHFDRTTYQSPPWRFEAGTGSIADAVGLGAAIDYLERIGMAAIEAAEHELLAYGTEVLCEVPGLHLYGHAQRKAGVLSFNVDGFEPVAVGEYLDQNGIAVRAGHHCAQPILRRFGTDATVRAALALYNTKDDMDRLAGALHRMVTGTPAV